MFSLNVTLILVSAGIGICVAVPISFVRDGHFARLSRKSFVELSAIVLGIAFFLAMAWVNIQIQPSITACESDSLGTVNCAVLNYEAGVQAELYLKSLLLPVSESVCLTGNAGACNIVQTHLPAERAFLFMAWSGYLLMLSMSFVAASMMYLSASYLLVRVETINLGFDMNMTGAFELS